MTLIYTGAEWSLDGTVYETRDEALSAAVADVPEKARVMPGAVTVWIPASSPEASGPVTADAVRAMADELNTSTHPRPIDGGSEDSPTHAYAERGDVPANGWTHRAAVAEIDGEPVLFLECEVLAHVAPLLTTGRLAFSSIHARFPVLESGEPDASRAELVSLGLTNDPANRSLPPISVVRDGRTFAHVVTRARLAGVCRMSEKKKEVVRSAEPSAEVTKAEPTMAEVMAKLDEAMMRIAALEGEKAEVMSERDALEATRSALTAEITELRASVPVEDAESRADALVEEAIRDGRIARRSKASYLEVARSNVEVFKRSIAALPKLGTTVVLRSEAKPSESAKDASVQAIEAAGERYYPNDPDRRQAFIKRALDAQKGV